MLTLHNAPRLLSRSRPPTLAALYNAPHALANYKLVATSLLSPHLGEQRRDGVVLAV